MRDDIFFIKARHDNIKLREYIAHRETFKDGVKGET